MNKSLDFIELHQNRAQIIIKIDDICTFKPMRVGTQITLVSGNCIQVDEETTLLICLLHECERGVYLNGDRKDWNRGNN